MAKGQSKSLFKKYVRKVNSGVDAAEITQDTLDLMNMTGTATLTGSNTPAQVGDYLVRENGKTEIASKEDFEAIFKPKFVGGKGKAKAATQEVAVAAEAVAS